MNRMSKNKKANLLDRLYKAIYDYYNFTVKHKTPLIKELWSEWDKICNVYMKTFDEAEQCGISDEIQFSIIQQVKQDIKCV